MKGIVFTELLDMIEQKFGYDMVDTLLTETDLPSGGVYTAIGTYDHIEIVMLVGKLSEKTNISVPDLVYTFGRHLFVVFAKSYGHFFEGVPDAFTFLESIHNYIHVEVKKLYPDAQLPNFEIHKENEQKMVMIYSSDRKMATLAHGLIDGCLSHFHEKAEVKTQLLTEDGSRVAFEIHKK
jgi:Haem-NO-binding